MGITIRNSGQGGTIRFTSLGLGGKFSSSAVSQITTTTTTAGLLLLDTYSGAGVAYSLRKLKSDYAGSAIRVRRSNDNSEQDIGFVNNQLDTASLTSFVGANSGFITRWYDQSGNAITASQSTAGNQPRIVNAGTIETQGGKPSVYFDQPSSHNLVTTVNVSTGTYMSTFMVTKDASSGAIYNYIARIGPPTPTGNFWCIVVQAGNASFDWLQDDVIVLGTGYNSGVSPRVISNGIVFNGTYILSSIFIGSANSGIYKNGSLATNRILLQSDVGAKTTDPLIIGSGGGLDCYNGHLSEFILYKSDQTSNRSGIETNINSNYSIY